MTARLRVFSRIAAKSTKPKISDFRLVRVVLQQLDKNQPEKKQTKEKKKVAFEQLERKQKSK